MPNISKLDFVMSQIFAYNTFLNIFSNNTRFLQNPTLTSAPVVGLLMLTTFYP